jgi:hypothetical protein
MHRDMQISDYFRSQSGTKFYRMKSDEILSLLFSKYMGCGINSKGLLIR